MVGWRSKLEDELVKSEGGEEKKREKTKVKLEMGSFGQQKMLN